MNSLLTAAGISVRARIASICILLAFGAGEAVGQNPAPAAGESVIQPGDRVRISVWRNDEMSGDFEVTADGTLLHPLYRAVQLSGASVSEAEARLRNFLTRLDANVRFVVQPLLAVAVGGEVQAPDLYHHAPHVTVAQAITLAGGATQFGRLENVRLLRSGSVQILDLREPNSPAARMPVRSGDEIVVERRRSLLRDVIAPIGSVVGMISSVAVLILRF